MKVVRSRTANCRLRNIQPSGGIYTPELLGLKAVEIWYASTDITILFHTTTYTAVHTLYQEGNYARLRCV